jgi:hypothetical protein
VGEVRGFTCKHLVFSDSLQASSIKTCSPNCILSLEKNKKYFKKGNLAPSIAMLYRGENYKDTYTLNPPVFNTNSYSNSAY